MNSILEDFKQAFRTGNLLNQLIVINVVVFTGLLVIRLVLKTGGQQEMVAFIESFFEFSPRLDLLKYRPWTLLTYGFTHYDIFHILFNMLFLYWFGRIITDYLGQRKILGLYIWGVISGSFLYLILYNLLPEIEFLGGPNPQMIGASAGVYAVMVGAATFQPNLSFHLILLGPIRIKYIAGFYILLSLAGVSGDNSGGNIAHLGGAFIGYLIITQLKKGNDWSKPITNLIAWFKSFFKRQPTIRVSYKKETPKRKPGKNPSKKGKASMTSQDEIDAILDKISERGYDALSKEEKQKLFNASKR